MNLVQVSFIAIGVVGVLGVLGMVAIVSGRTPRSFNWRKNVDKKALKVDKSKTSFLAPEEPESVEEVNITEDVDEGTDAESTEETDGSIKIEEKVIYEEISEEEAGITRRQFLTKALRISFGAFAGIQVIPAFIPEARAYVLPFDSSEVGASQFSDGSTIADGLVAIYQRCVHLGCRVPWCNSSQGFECPCHGSKYNMVGEYYAGPAPRNLDRFVVSVNTAGKFIIDTGTIIESPRAGGLSVKYPQGLSCIALTTTDE